MSTRSSVRLAAITVMSLVLMACGGGSSSVSCAPVNPNCGSQVQSFNAMGVDGPMAFAIVELFRLQDYRDGSPINLLSASERSDINGAATGIELLQSDANGAAPGAGPFVLQVRSEAGVTIDTTTGVEPVVKTIRTLITSAAWAAKGPSTRFYATPLTTIGLEQAIARAGTGSVENELVQASADVVQAFGFGLSTAVNIFDTPPVLDASTAGNLALQQNVARYRAAIESFATMIGKVATSQSVTSQQVMSLVASDMANGLPGNAYVGEGGSGAVVNAVVAEVSAVTATYLTDNNRLPTGTANIEELLDGELADNAALAGATGTVNADPQPADFDGDGTPNTSDSDNYDPASSADTDGDLVDDSVDNCVNDANAGQENYDAGPDNIFGNTDDRPNADALGDACDTDADGDGVAGDGMGGPGADVNDLDNTVATDPDGDGIDSSAGAGTGTLNGPDNCPSVANTNQENLDSDAFGNLCDNDADGDGFDGDGMGGPGVDPNDLDASIQPGNSDGDTIGDLATPRDNCPATTNQDQAAGTTPAGGPGTGEPPFGTACDADDDGIPSPDQNTGVSGELGEGLSEDNCPAIANTDQLNTDGDAFGDACDDDIDGDGIPNAADPQPLVAVSSYHFDLFYTQQSSNASDFQLATKSESVVQLGFPSLDTATSNGLDLGVDGLGTGDFNITSDYETVEDTLGFAGAGCTASDCFATATPAPVANSAIATADVSAVASYTEPVLTVGASSMLPWGNSSFVGAGRVELAVVGTAPLATLQEQGLSALQYTDTLSDDADLNGVYGIVDMSVNYASAAATANALISSSSRVFDATLDGAGAITASGAMSAFDAAVGTSDATVTFTDTAQTAGIYSVQGSGLTQLTFGGETLTGVSDADGELIALTGGNQRGYAVKLGAPSIANLVAGGDYALEGLVVNGERGQISAATLEGATIAFTDQGGGNIKATLKLGGEVARSVSTFDAANNALPTVGTAAGPGGSHSSEVFTMDPNGRFSTIAFGLNLSTKRFDIEGFFVPGKGLLLRYVESAIESSGGASSSIVFYCGDAAGQTFVNPDTGNAIVPQPTGFTCGFVQQGSAGSGTRVSDLARGNVGVAQQFSTIEAPAGTVISGPDGFGQGIVWGAPAN